ncbi:hypothetical protein CYY_010209 [Polysphondylium violaceum]|uniref:Uncharacterized protein n=1 Tax=Polysphondylium violaceum TaxID=133409 RepID=A0A8J4PK86_9MYCE|nr:hypothetical protein CYY_010209 [Polysphondylium violaceum]
MDKVDSFVCNRFCSGSKGIYANPEIMADVLQHKQSLLYIHHLRINSLLVPDDFRSETIQQLMEFSRKKENQYKTKIGLSTIHYLERYKFISVSVPIPTPTPQC